MPPESTPQIVKEAVGNPLSDNLNVTLSVPQTIEIKMVDASALSDYEVSFFITSLCFSAFFGFVVPFVQSFTADRPNPDKALGCFSAFLLILSLVFRPPRRHAALRCFGVPSWIRGACGKRAETG